jgi:CO/xanthine dehydrogenase Mo-binding subunit
MQGMLYCALIRSTIAHGTLLDIDPSGALAVPGVRAVITAKDIPGKLEYGAPYEDHPVLAYDRVRFIGDPIAIIVAETITALELGRQQVRVLYHELPAAFTLNQVMAEDAPRIHSGGNLLACHHLKRGNIEKGFQMAAAIIEDEYSTDWQDHAFLEPVAVIGFFDEEDMITVISPTQNPFSVRYVTAQMLGLELDDVRIQQAEIGGSFGGKNDFVYQASAQVALASWLLKCPVSLVMSREECMRAGNKRHPMVIRHRTGVTEEGLICAAEVTMRANGGAYASVSPFVMWRAVTHACGPYNIPNVRVEGEVYYSNNVPAASMRGFGSTQATFAVERHMDQIAKAIGMNPAELRRRNMLRVGDTTISGEKLGTSVGINLALDRALELIGYEDRRQCIIEPGSHNSHVKGLGIALSHHGVSLGADEGRDYAGAILELTENGRIVCETGITDMGTGARTVLAQIASQELEVPLDAITVNRVDTVMSPDSNKTVASRGTFVGGMAVYHAATDLKKQLLETAADYLGVEMGSVRLKNGRFQINGSGVQSDLDLTELATWASSKGIHLRSSYHHELPLLEWNAELGQGQAFYSYGYGAQVAEVTVNRETGQVDLDRLAVVVDCGRAINPDALRGQILGGAVMGIGYALFEELELNGGKVGNCNFDTYLIPTAVDMGEILVDWVEMADDQGPYGAKGVAELTTVGVAPAILNAISNATGVPINDLPANLERVFLGRSLGKDGQ